MQQPAAGAKLAPDALGDLLVELADATREAVPGVALAHVPRGVLAAPAALARRSSTARTIASASASSSSGGTSQPSGSPGTTLTKLGGPPLSVPITGSPQAIASR